MFETCCYVIACDSVLIFQYKSSLFQINMVTSVSLSLSLSLSLPFSLCMCVRARACVCGGVFFYYFLRSSLSLSLSLSLVCMFAVVCCLLLYYCCFGALGLLYQERIVRVSFCLRSLAFNIKEQSKFSQSISTHPCYQRFCQQPLMCTFQQQNGAVLLPTRLYGNIDRWKRCPVEVTRTARLMVASRGPPYSQFRHRSQN